MKNLRSLLLILVAALLFTACKKEDSAILLNISGEVLVQDALTPTITTPLEGITVYLLNSPFSIDTTNWWFTKTDMLDSTLTDSNGLYKFEHLQAGNYVVLPINPMINYQFDWSTSPDPNTISVENTQPDYTINFIAPEVVAENSPGSYTFIFNNSGNHPNSYIKIYRKSRTRDSRISSDPIFKDKWWGEWKDEEVSEIKGENLGDLNSYIPNQANTYCHEYNDHFVIKLGYYDSGMIDKPVFSYDVDNPLPNNVVNITWTPFTATANFPLAMGDSYQGGIIAYVLQAGDPGFDANVSHGLIAAPSDQGSNVEWGPAIDICANLSLNGYTDWYLPSLVELKKLYTMKVFGFADFASRSYWSSKEANQWDAYKFSLRSGYMGINMKSDNLFVRAVRVF